MSIRRTAPVGNTCRDIDQVIDAIKNSYRSADNITHYADSIEVDEYWSRELQNLKDEASEIESNLWKLEDQLEELRSANSELRDWGEELVAEYEELELELEKVL